jgi:hypothetical protein
MSNETSVSSLDFEYFEAFPTRELENLSLIAKTLRRERDQLRDDLAYIKAWPGFIKITSINGVPAAEGHTDVISLVAQLDVMVAILKKRQDEIDALKATL